MKKCPRCSDLDTWMRLRAIDQRTMAHRLRISDSHLSNIRRRLKRPSYRLAIKIWDETGVRFDFWSGRLRRPATRRKERRAA